MKIPATILAFGLAVLAGAQTARAQDTAIAAKPLFTWREVMIPVQGSVHLETMILAPAEQMPGSWKVLMADGYIMVFRICGGGSRAKGISS